MTVPRAKLLLLPGLAMNARLFEFQRSSFPDLVVPAWPQPSMDDTLPSFAEKCVQSWTQSPASILRRGEPIFLGGVSLGGVMALEVAIALTRLDFPVSGVLLISSCRSHSAVPDRFRWQQWLGNAVPDGLLHWFFKRMVVPRMVKKEWLTTRQRELLEEMLREIDLGFFRWSAKAYSQWRRTREQIDQFQLTIHQIHGRLDELIPPPSVEDATLLLQGKHMTPWTQAEEVNRWIAAILSDDQLRRQHQSNTHEVK